MIAALDASATYEYEDDEPLFKNTPKGAAQPYIILTNTTIMKAYNLFNRKDA